LFNGHAVLFAANVHDLLLLLLLLLVLLLLRGGLHGRDDVLRGLAAAVVQRRAALVGDRHGRLLGLSYFHQARQWAAHRLVVRVQGQRHRRGGHWLRQAHAARGQHAAEVGRVFGQCSHLVHSQTINTQKTNAK